MIARRTHLLSLQFEHSVETLAILRKKISNKKNADFLIVLVKMCITWQKVVSDNDSALVDNACGEKAIKISRAKLDFSTRSKKCFLDKQRTVLEE